MTPHPARLRHVNGLSTSPTLNGSRRGHRGVHAGRGAGPRRLATPGDAQHERKFRVGITTQPVSAIRAIRHRTILAVNVALTTALAVALVLSLAAFFGSSEGESRRFHCYRKTGLKRPELDGPELRKPSAEDRYSIASNPLSFSGLRMPDVVKALLRASLRTTRSDSI